MQQGSRRLPGSSVSDGSGVIFYTGTVSHFCQHFQIVRSAGFKTFCFQKFTTVLQNCNPFFQFSAYSVSSRFQHFRGNHKVLGRINDSFVKFFDYFSGNSIKSSNTDYFFPIKLYTIRLIGFHVCRIHFDNVTPYSELSSIQNGIVSFILQSDKLFAKGSRL